ncbi:PP2C-domain-containing protein [Marasmius fiardii PR-910]|nr:PP2C-domain-containing protein [Marasmius fiardii PR-910]
MGAPFGLPSYYIVLSPYSSSLSSSIPYHSGTKLELPHLNHNTTLPHSRNQLPTIGALYSISSQNAHSQPITVTSGSTTYGVLNQLPSGNMSYRIGIHAAQGIRSTMEDTHAFVVDFDSVHGQGYFAVFDGHGNKNVSEWCGSNFHKILLETIQDSKDLPTLEIMREAFRRADEKLEQVSDGKSEWCDSGSTAVVAFLRYEDEDGSQRAFETSSIKRIPDSLGSSISIPGAGVLREPSPNARRVFYCANAGDARAVMCRNGVAARLTQDHKASDEDEKARIRQAGGIVLRGRVLGALAVSRSLGDHVRYEGLRLKDYVIGTPYTSKTELNDGDEFCIIACDGLWDVISDQQAVNMIRYQDDVQKASETLVNFALQNEYLLSRDNVTVMVVRFASAPKAT